MNLESARARWLRPRVLSSAINQLASDIPAPLLASLHSTPAVRQYLLWWIAHPDPAGRFAAHTRLLRCLPAAVRVRALFALGYDGLVYLKDGAVMGHVFFQRHGRMLHGFSTAVSDPFDGRGYSVVMMLDFVAHAHNTPGVTGVRIGAGQNNVTRRFLERIIKHGDQFGWRVSLDGWVMFVGASEPELQERPGENVLLTDRGV
jgi:hypothetical protein